MTFAHLAGREAYHRPTDEEDLEPHVSITITGPRPWEEPIGADPASRDGRLISSR